MVVRRMNQFGGHDEEEAEQTTFRAKAVAGGSFFFDGRGSLNDVVQHVFEESGTDNHSDYVAVFERDP